jgi:hypothetical protein
MKTLIITAAILVASFTSQATIFYYSYAVKFTMLAQDTAGGTTATKFSIITKTMLDYAAQAEFSAGHYTGFSFPVGSRLVYEYDDAAQTGRFVVQDIDRNIICDLSDIMWLDISDSVKTQTPTSSTGIYQETFHYDSTGAGLNLEFEVSYLTSETTKLGIHTCKGTTGTGAGDLGGRTLVFTGSSSSTTK